jgi:anaerobic selenocysteine-containing dehydrogenase
MKPTRRDLLRAAAATGCSAALAGTALSWLCPAASQALRAPEAVLEPWYRGICGQCGMADTLFVGARGGRAVSVKGDPVSPVNYGRLCTRGMAFPAGLDPDRRTTQPLLRRDAGSKGSDSGLEPVDWEEALAWLGEHVAPAARRTPNGLATFLDVGLSTEALFVFNRLLRGFVGCATLESNLRLDAMAGVVAAERGLGLFGASHSLDALDEAGAVLVVGADPAERHPTLFGRMAQCHRRGTSRVVVIDPRRTLTCGLADVHIRPKVPGTDGVILASIARHLLESGRTADDPRLDAFAAAVAGADPATAARISGARQEDIEAAGATLGEAFRTVTMYGRGLTRCGTEAVRTLYDVHILLGDGAIVPLLEGANALGAHLMGCAADRLPGFRRVTTPTDREAVAAAWSSPPDRMPTVEGLPLAQWPGAVERGEIETMLLVGSNLLPLLPDFRSWRSAMSSCRVVAATPLAPTETTAFADLVLPMSLPWLEDRGCYINHERRVQLTDPAGPAPGVPTALELTEKLAGALLTGEHDFGRYIHYGPELAWEECGKITAGRDCDLSGLSYAALAAAPGLAWPMPAGADAPLEPTTRPALGAPSMAEVQGADDRLFLVVFADSHHTGGRELTGFAPDLHYASPRAWVEVSGRDAVNRKLRDGSWVALESETGVLVARMWITDRVCRGTVAVPEHFGFVSDLEGGTDGRGEPGSLPGLVVRTRTDTGSNQLCLSGTRVELREPTDDEMAVRTLKKS